MDCFSVTQTFEAIGYVVFVAAFLYASARLGWWCGG